MYQNFNHIFSVFFVVILLIDEKDKINQ